MADPFTIIGTAGAVAGLMDVLAKSISALRDMHERWKDADFMLLNLAAQLSALRAALREIQTWVDSESAEPHHQLVMDLDFSMACCKMLVAKMDKSISDLQVTATHNLDFGSKYKSRVRGQDYGYNTSREQKILLEKTTSRKVLKQVRDDTSSLYVLCDSSSVSSRYTDCLSKISIVFQFDRKLFVSRVYERALRGSLKDVMRQRQMYPTQSRVKEDYHFVSLGGKSWEMKVRFGTQIQDKYQTKFPRNMLSNRQWHIRIQCIDLIAKEMQNTNVNIGKFTPRLATAVSALCEVEDFEVQVPWLHEAGNVEWTL
ncbi:hypothetical protein BU16DRAFT_557938 [Lophium mytilinum]|uniref:Uncharacterized protein n=1 Tax=Lophium mytilinum TaxID=390894 RepID=A0A6A6R5K2_9PEZI|nr:hypothetical protein BU16DRAFT_557938 [Lophium mytilinum]